MTTKQCLLIGVNYNFISYHAVDDNLLRWTQHNKILHINTKIDGKHKWSEDR